ncbi:E3 ubiquitin-protein ligase Praja-2 isoform X1 [Myiozetetes cayanensis]|uniref:E3 ubiquitin-protein ligase Praja-2 isoform X1 n=1 Tax=Myiozetetes cayanensis TaxID=478635 RepID=UPI0021603C1A|nr:E3 ubiquitin-protein ligase Praja-2 isoform X1 [Myiozetetes cayanensis]XP_050184357.1 E3 ubiquitin-protein ligase Praja-2 isoform X1 [Myiozetetes cayanensis]XP_050184358.1 E3 ubiquitin-protein ligase Praja-2 isoform X1 [Myiozetetes cayanensis]XP_050184359.1 E3 ubiquitin-protein ligase Praja-2 isoform X1 [Myiozetetes cayanensis]
MGQAAAKPASPKSARTCQTVMGRRHGRRHTWVGFRPLWNSEDGDAHQPNKDFKQLDLEDVQEENSLSFSESSRPLVQVPPALLDKPLSENAGTREPICQNVSSQTSEVNRPPFSVVCTGLEGNEISQNFMNPDENSEDFAKNTSGRHNDLNGKNGIAFVNIDSYEPDSSDGEEDDAEDKCSSVKDVTCLIQGRIDNILSQCEKDVECLTDLESRLSALNYSVSRENCEGAGPVLLACPDNRTLTSTEDQPISKSNLSGTSCETQQINNIVNVGIGTPVADVLNVTDGKADQEKSSGPVVRPKIRTRNTASHLEGEKQLPNDDEEEKRLSSPWKRIGVADGQHCHPECPLRDSKEISSGMFFLSRVRGDQKNTERDLGKNAATQNQKSFQDDSSFWDESEDSNRYYLMSHEDEDSSECSDGEWATAMPACLTTVEQEQSSSEESWETLSGRDECEVQSITRDVKEENTNCGFQEGEEGELVWFQYQEEVESSSDEENYPINDFIHPAFFLFSGNNNFEDDSSVSEDMDVEWRTLDEFEVLGLALDIPYVNPQLLTFVALEGRLEAMEAALAQLESLAIDVEQTHPPATKETIDCLPVVLITGQDQSCTICCSEYVRGEFVAELPCHHLFHKPCVTPWLQRSGTCPVCRHVLAPVLPEAADDTYR